MWWQLNHVKVSQLTQMIFNVKWIQVIQSCNRIELMIRLHDWFDYLLYLLAVSLSAASERLARDGHHIVGWYHSHPTFVPNPSLRDLETQAEFQSLFAKDQNTPFLALILNPYSSQSTHLSPSTTTTSNAHRSNLVSRYKCLMLSDQDVNQVNIPSDVLVINRIYLQIYLLFFTGWQ